MKYFDDCDNQEVADYDVAEETKELTLRRSKTKLALRNVTLASTDSEYRENKAKIADLKAEIAVHLTRVDAFYDIAKAIHPPSKPQLAELKKNLDEVNKLTTNRRIVDEVVAATTAAIKVFNQIQPT